MVSCFIEGASLLMSESLGEDRSDPSAEPCLLSESDKSCEADPPTARNIGVPCAFPRSAALTPRIRTRDDHASDAVRPEWRPTSRLPDHRFGSSRTVPRRCVGSPRRGRVGLPRHRPFPAGRAIECARAAGQAILSMGLEVRAGVHTGELDISRGDVQGMAVHIGARIGALASAGRCSYRAR